MVKKAVVLGVIGVILAGLGAEGTTTTAGAQAVMAVPALVRVSDPVTQVGGREIKVAVRVPPEMAGPSAAVELAMAVVLVVQSNVRWTLVVRPPDDMVPPEVEVRTGWGTYQLVRPEGLVLAKGMPGVHEIVLDYRVVGGGPGGEGEHLLTLVYAVEG